MIKHLLICLFLLSALAPTWAGDLDWQLLNKGSKYGLGDDYISMKSLKVSGEQVTYWRRNHWPGAQAYYTKTKKPTLQDTLTHEVVDCKGKKIKRLKGVVNFLGTPPKDEKTQLEATDFNIVASDTYTEELFNKVCTLAKKKH